MRHSAYLARQWTLYDAQEFEHAWRDARSILQGLQGEDLRDARRLMGLCCYRQRQYDEAVNWLRQACQGSTDSNDWLWLALVATRRGGFEESAEAFVQARMCQQVAKFAQPPGIHMQVYTYALVLCEAGDWVRLQPLLDELRSVYERIGCTDTAYLYRQGLPFLASFLALAVHRFRAQEQYVQGLAWLQALALEIDDEGKRQVSRAMSELREADAGSALA